MVKEPSSRRGELIGSYRIENNESIFKVLRYKDSKTKKEHFWLYRGDCLCHARDHKTIKKNKITFENYTSVEDKIIYDRNRRRIGKVTADHPDSATPLEIKYNHKLYKLYETGLTKNTVTTSKLSWEFI